MKSISAFFTLVLALAAAVTQAQTKEVLPVEDWTASWIAPPDAPANEYGVYHFRKSIELASVPDSFVVHISGDNRYKLYVNGQLASLGPARSDEAHWRFETADLAPYLKEGNNTLAAVVWNFGEHRAMAQHSWRTGFILQGKGEEERIADTNASWKAIRNGAYEPIEIKLHSLYYVSGPAERVDFSKYIWGWEEESLNEGDWVAATLIAPASSEEKEGWVLTPDPLPQMEMSPQRLKEVRRSTGVEAPSEFVQGNAPLHIPAKTKASLILDQGFLTNAYPVLRVSGGKGAKLSLGYAESLYEVKPGPEGFRGEKGNRDEVEGKEFFGVEDEYLTDGSPQRIISPLWWRTYRYIQLEVETGDDPLIVHELTGIFTAYPFEKESRFQAVGKAEELDKILDIGWRSARLCAHETYMDTPYYEQLQYIGDARIQMLVTLFNTHDDRLVRNGIKQISYSVSPEGITMSRYPSREPQYIPPFSLWWIGMLHDYWRYRGGEDFIRQFLPVSRSVINFFAEKQHPDGSLQPLPHWSFTDWVQDEDWERWGSEAPSTEAGNSAALDLQLLLGYQAAASLEGAVGDKEQAKQYQTKADQLKETSQKLYWDTSRQLFSDTPEMKHYSQQTNTLAVLGGLVKGAEAQRLMEKVLADTSLTQASIYFKYYLHRAAAEAGLGNQYIGLLDEWRAQMNRGMTTWAERHEPSRSDCHAWGASPNIEFFRIVLGIDSDAPGFQKVRIAPNLGTLKSAAGSIPHPKGEIKVNYQLNDKGKMKAEIALPEGVTGTFIWKGKEKNLKGGKQTVEI